LALGFTAGIVTAAWAVCISPAVAQLTTEKNRPVAFSFVFSTGILIGVVGGLAGGRLPGLLTRLHIVSSVIESYRGALLVGNVLVLLAVWPLLQVTMTAPAPSE